MANLPATHSSPAHGEGAAARMHGIEGVEEMMAECSKMMDMMGGRDTSHMGESRHDRGMMDGTMYGGGSGGGGMRSAG